MKTAEEKAREWIERWISEEEFEDGFSDKQGYINSLAKVLKEQDKATRHACAEAVSGIVPGAFYGDESLIYQNEARSAVISTKAV